MSGWPRRGGSRESQVSGRSRCGGTATDRELAVVAAVVAAGSEKAAAHRLGLSHSTVQAPPGERAVQGRARDDGAAGVDPGAAAAGAGGRVQADE